MARFQGTVMHPYLGRPLSLARKLEEVVALRTPAELYVMTDDGTQGDEVLARLNQPRPAECVLAQRPRAYAAIRPPASEAIEARVGLGFHRTSC